MKNKFRGALLSAAATIGFAVPVLSNAPMATADPCIGSWSVVMAGAQVGFATGTGQDSSYLVGDQRVGYNTLDPNGGLAELDRLINKHRNECPDDHIRLLGHSEGAGIVHAWVTAHNGYGDINAILLSDPKRTAGPGGPGLANDPLSAVFGFPVGPDIQMLVSMLIGYPLAGVDDWFGDIPVLEICDHDDEVCNVDAGWNGYLFGGAHGRYDGDAANYGDWDSGVWFQ